MVAILMMEKELRLQLAQQEVQLALWIRATRRVVCYWREDKWRQGKQVVASVTVLDAVADWRKLRRWSSASRRAAGAVGARCWEHGSGHSRRYWRVHGAAIVIVVVVVVVVVAVVY